MSGSVVLLAKRGPQPRELDPNAYLEKPTLARTMHARHAAGGLTGNFTHGFFGRGPSWDMALTKTMSHQVSNSSATSAQAKKWRMSVASSAFRVERQISRNHSVVAHPFIFGGYPDRTALADHTVRHLGGERTPAAGGQAAVYYNSAQQKNENVNFVNGLGDIKSLHVNTSAIWDQVWWAYYVLRLAGSSDAIAVTWNARPDPPLSVEVALRGLNHYVDMLPVLSSGSRINIEIGQSDLDIYPYLVLLLGMRQDTLHINYGVNAGNNRTPHLLEVDYDIIDYHIYVRDLQQPLPAAFNAAAPPLPGLNAGQAANNQAFGVIDEALLSRAMHAICESAPIQADLEASFWANLPYVFAEMFRGVADIHDTGDGAQGAGWDAFVREGGVYAPGGSHICNLLTVLTRDSVQTKNAKSLMSKLLDMTPNVRSMRIVIEPLVVAFQRGARQCGATIPTFFSHQNPAAIVDQANYAMNAVVEVGHARSALFETDAEAPSVLWTVTEAMVWELYGSSLPATLLYYQVGSMNDTAAACPFDIAAIEPCYRGECLNSVHPAQLASGLLVGSARGLAGIPDHLGEMAAEMEFSNTGADQIQVVKGDSSSRETKEGIVLDAGINMLGHTVTLRRDSNVAAQGHFRVAIVPAAFESAGMLQIQFQPFPRNLRRAFVPDVGNLAANWDRGVDLVDDHMELYADFDVLCSMDLALGLDLEDGAYDIATDSNRRRLLPGYTMASTSGPTPTGVTGAKSVLSYPQRKKRRVAGASDDNEPAGPNAGGGGATA
jgi:hypothetical protein